MSFNFIKEVKPNAVLATVLAANVMLQPSYPAVLMFVGFLAFVAHAIEIDSKRAAEVKFATVQKILDRLDKIDVAVEALNSDVESVRKNHTEAHRVAEEAKKLLSQANLSNSLTHKTKRL